MKLFITSLKIYKTTNENIRFLFTTFFTIMIYKFSSDNCNSHKMCIWNIYQANLRCMGNIMVYKLSPDSCDGHEMWMWNIRVCVNSYRNFARAWQELIPKIKDESLNVSKIFGRMLKKCTEEQIFEIFKKMERHLRYTESLIRNNGCVPLQVFHISSSVRQTWNCTHTGLHPNKKKY